MGDKPFKTLNEQIAILRERGLTISDERKAKEFLYFNNYYRISGYSLTLRDHDVFYENATFENIMEIYGFDHELRHILLKYIEQIEVKLKSIFAYEFSKVYGKLGQYNSSNFTNNTEYLRITEKADEQKKKRLSHEAFLKHFVEEKQEKIPLWAYVDLLSIADISMLFQISKTDVKDAVARSFNLTMKERTTILGEYMHGMTILRNLCAHGSRLYNRLFIRKPSLNSKEKRLLIQDEKGVVDNAHLYGYIITMRRMLSEEQFASMKEEFIALQNKYPFVSMRYYGFREDWKEAL